jgi:hypothetical protein
MLSNLESNLETCKKCKKPRYTDKHVYCYEHVMINRRRVKLRRERFIEMGCCGRCGTFCKKNTCDDCAEKNKKYTRSDKCENCKGEIKPGKRKCNTCWQTVYDDRRTQNAQTGQCVKCHKICELNSAGEYYRNCRDCLQKNLNRKRARDLSVPPGLCCRCRVEPVKVSDSGRILKQCIPCLSKVRKSK